MEVFVSAILPLSPTATPPGSRTGLVWDCFLPGEGVGATPVRRGWSSLRCCWDTEICRAIEISTGVIFTLVPLPMLMLPTVLSGDKAPSKSSDSWVACVRDEDARDGDRFL